MKKFLLFTVAVLISGASAFAQTTFGNIDPAMEAKCTKITRAMALELRLNEPEYIKLKDLNRKRMLQTDELLETYGNDSVALQEKLNELEKSYEKDVISFLTPNQLHAYATYKKEASQVKFVASSKE